MSHSRYIGVLLCSAMLALLTACSDPAPGNRETTAESGDKTAKVHGTGKKELDCDMAHLTVEHGNTSSVIVVDELLSKTGAEVAYEDDPRIQDEPALSLAELIDQYDPAAGSAVLFSCGETQGTSLDAAIIAQSPERYLLTENKVGRLRVAIFNENRRRYRTLVKNLVRIRLEQPSG